MSSQTTNFTQLTQVRVAIPAANTWVPLIIPTGAHDAIVSLEDSTAKLRVSADSGIDPATEGLPIAIGFFLLRGTCVKPITIYVASSVEPTHGIALFTVG
jgi:hypothetical protein